MPKQLVTGPDGQKFIVNAPAGATQDEIKAYAKANAPLGFIGTVRAGAGAFLNMALPNAADEIYGAKRAAYDGFASLGGGAPFNLGESFRKGQADFQERDDRFAKQSPAIRRTAQGVGLVGGALALPEARVFQGGRLAAAQAAALPGAITAAAKQVATRADRWAAAGNAAITGGATGFVSGLATGETAAERGRNAVQGGVFGTGLGFVAPSVISGAASTVRGVRNIAAPYANATEDAYRRLAQGLDDSGLNPMTAATELARRVSAGVPAIVGDLSDSTRKLAGWASRGMGAGQQRVRELLQNRQSGMAARMRGHVDSTLGPTANPIAQSEGLRRTAQAAAAPLYREAYREPVNITPGLQDFLDSPVGNPAITSGVRDVEMIPYALRAPGSETSMRPVQQINPQTGQMEYTGVPVMQAWDGAKRHLDDLEFQTNNRFVPNPQGMSSDTYGLDLRRQQILGELDNQVPAYAAARRAYAGPTQEKAAFEAGMGTAPGSRVHTPEEAASAMQNMTPSQLAQYQLGNRTQLAGRIHGGDNSMSRWADASGPILSRDGAQETLGTIHGPAAADNLADVARMEREAHLTYKEAFGGSESANRLAADADALAPEAMANAAGQAARGNILGAAGSMAMAAFRGTLGRHGEAVKTELGRMIVQSSPRDVAHLMQMVEQRAAQDETFRRLLWSSASKASTLTTRGVMAAQADRPR